MKAYIFACNALTMGECFSLNLFGVAKPYVKDVSIGDFCYLYNYDERKLYGLWKAQSGCSWHEKQAWGGKFRFQVRVELISKTFQSVPLYSVMSIIQVQGNITWKLYGDKAHNLLQYFASKYSSEVTSGIKLNELEEDYRKRHPTEYMCDDGHRVRSLSEQAIDNWLYKHGIYHAYEPIVPIPEQLIPDFMVNTLSGECVYIEFWGMIDDPVYKNRMNKKVQIYSNRHFPLIELRPGDLKSLDYIFPKKLMQRNVPITK
jgi:hypothetical protein